MSKCQNNNRIKSFGTYYVNRNLKIFKQPVNDVEKSEQELLDIFESKGWLCYHENGRVDDRSEVISLKIPVETTLKEIIIKYNKLIRECIEIIKQYIKEKTTELIEIDETEPRKHENKEYKINLMGKKEHIKISPADVYKIIPDFLKISKFSDIISDSLYNLSSEDISLYLEKYNSIDVVYVISNNYIKDYCYYILYQIYFDKHKVKDCWMTPYHLHLSYKTYFNYTYKNIFYNLKLETFSQDLLYKIIDPIIINKGLELLYNKYEKLHADNYDFRLYRKYTDEVISYYVENIKI